MEVKACEVRLRPRYSVAEGVVVAKWVPTYTGGEPRETRFEELKLYCLEVLELYCLEKLESGGRRSES